MKVRFLKTGFTLTELLIVVVIIGILASISLPVMTKTIEKAKTAEAVANLNLIRIAEKSYFLENNRFTDEIGNLSIENPDIEPSRSFMYSIPNANRHNFTARAQRIPNAPAPYNVYGYEISKDGIIYSDGPFFPNRPDDPIPIVIIE